MGNVSENLHKKSKICNGLLYEMNCFYSDHIASNNCHYYGKHESKLKSILSCKRPISEE